MEELRLWGTIVNALALIAGSIIGLLLRWLLGGKNRNGRMEMLSDSVLKGLALCVFSIGISGTIKGAVNDLLKDTFSGSATEDAVSGLAGESTLIIIISMALGALIGHLIDFDRGINKLGERVEALTKARFGNVAQGFVSTSLVCCVGSMTIVGALNSGLFCDHTMLYTKSILDLVTAIVFAVTMGIGVMFSAAFLFIFQGTITLLAQWVSPFLTDDVIMSMSIIGSILIMGLALRMLGAVKIKIMNYMPAIFMPAILIPLSNWLFGLL